jgi:poly(A) polymerase
LNTFIKFIKRAVKRKKPPHGEVVVNTPVSANIIARADHGISRKAISDNALKVLTHLHHSGFSAYLVGGGVRDLLLGREPKDFDVATDAKPEQVRKIFRNCRLIGRRFRLAHVFFKAEIIEVATFRSASDDSYEEQDKAQSLQGIILSDNIYGNLEDDVWRRDFTVNALYYNIADFSLVDFTQGISDLNQGIIRVIGEPEQRFREDPVRMLRAVRFAAKLGFRIHADTAKPIGQMGELLAHVPPARLFDEILKLFLAGYAQETFAQLRHYNLFQWLFPLTEASLTDTTTHQDTDCLIMITLKNTDERVHVGKPVTPAFLLTAMLWYPICKQTEEIQQQGVKKALAFEKAIHKIIQIQGRHISIPRRYLTTMQEICQMQYHLESRRGKHPLRLVQQQRFRAGYDFLLMRAHTDPSLKPLADWWTHFQTADQEEQLAALAALKPIHPRQKPKATRVKS